MSSQTLYRAERRRSRPLPRFRDATWSRSAICRPSRWNRFFIWPAWMKARPEDFRTALAGKHMAMFFEKPSLRTRLTFEAGMSGLGGTVSFMDQRHERLDAREKLSDIAHNLERWVSANRAAHLCARNG